jgi:hypothetical protein
VTACHAPLDHAATWPEVVAFMNRLGHQGSDTQAILVGAFATKSCKHINFAISVCLSTRNKARTTELNLIEFVMRLACGCTRIFPPTVRPRPFRRHCLPFASLQPCFLSSLPNMCSVTFSASLLFCTEAEASAFLRNVCELEPDDTALRLRRQYSF